MSGDEHSPVRILRIISSLQVSGPALQAILLTHGLDHAGYQTLLVAGRTNEQDNMIDRAAEYGVQPRIIRALTTSVDLLRDLVALVQLIRLIRRYRPHVVHTHLTTAGFLGRLAARLAGVPVIVHTMHVHPFHGHYGRLQTITFTRLEQIGAHFSDSIITLSEGLRRDLTERYHITSKKRITVLPLGFDLNRFAQTPRKQGRFRAAWGIPPGAPLAGLIGRLMPVKNPGLFLEAAGRVRAEFPEAWFAVVGDGELRPALEAQARAAGLADRTVFTGWQRDMTAVYSDLDVLAVSSLNEGTPVPIIEALVAGCPVVAAAVGGIPDLLDHGKHGTLVPPDNPRALAEAMIRTMQQPSDPEPARTVMLDRYGIDRLVQDLDSLYRGLLARKRA